MPKESPYCIRTTEGNLVIYCNTEAESIALAIQKNKQAEALGITTRYAASYEPQ